MLKIKVIADNILNLTDARYFAAFGVDYLVFNLENIRKESIKEINDWVEGVNVLLEFNESLTPELFDFILQLSPHGFVSTSTSILKELQDQFKEAEVFIREGGTTETHSFNKLVSTKSIDLKNTVKTGQQKVFVMMSDPVEELETIINSENIEGIIVEGKPEEKVGFKNFDELDEIFEQLTIEY